MTSLPATSSDTVNNGSRASGKSGKHQPSEPSAPSRHRPLLLELNGETEVSHSVTVIGLSSNARQDIHRQAAERLALMGRAVSVSQSPPHGCCQRSGYAAGVPTRPATSVLGGFATLSAPACPSSCAAATAAVRCSEDNNQCAASRDKAHQLRKSVLYYSCTSGVLTIPQRG